MAQRGVFFALLAEDVAKLRAAATDEELLQVVSDDIEERWDEPWLFQTDKAWAGIHRCLTDGRLAHHNGDYPLSACVLGGEQMYRGDDYIVSFLAPEQVVDVAVALQGVNESWLRAKYFGMNETEYGAPLTDEDYDYIRDWFTGLPDFFRKAADAGRAVIFTVDL
jgi:hypothetical protein